MEQKQTEKTSVYSYHTFIFPFLWNNGGRVQRSDFERCIDKTRWKPDLFDDFHHRGCLDDLRRERYAQYQYFDAPARRALYTAAEDPQHGIVRNYLYSPELLAWDEAGAFYVISKGGYTYRLRLNGLRLKLYNSGIGFLVYELENTEHKTMEDVNRINEYGRRIYCPYIYGVNDLTSSLTADSIRLEGADFPSAAHESQWLITADAGDPEKTPKTRLATAVTMLLTCGGVSVTTDEKAVGADTLYIEPIIDDRMFVACFAQDRSFTDLMAEWNGFEYRWLSDALEKAPDAEDSAARRLYEFVFVDGDGITCFDRPLLHKLLKEHVYARWLEYRSGGELSGSIYGITEYSMVCASASSFPAGTFLTQYVELAMLALAQRASLIAFERQISHVSTDESKERELMEAYVRFQSQLLFKEVTPQQQGIELYDMLLEALFVNKQKDDVESQIRNLFELKKYHSEQHENFVLKVIAVIGVIGVLAGIVSALDVILRWLGLL